MHPVYFEGSIEIKKPDSMTDEQCISAWAKFGFDKLYKVIQGNGIITIPPGLYAGVDQDEFSYYLTAWQPNKEDLKALNEGRPIFIKTLSKQLPPMAVFTLDENDGANF